MRRIIITVAAGDEWRVFTEKHMISSMRRYAAKVDADFLAWGNTPTDKKHMYYAWWDALAWVVPQGYHKILVLDSDVMPKEGADNIFEVPFKDIAMIHVPHWRDEMDACHELLSPDFGPQDMYNTGVILLENEFAGELLKMAGEFDQSLLRPGVPIIEEWVMCYMLKMKGVSVTPLDKKWNYNSKDAKAITPSVNFVHFLGRPRRIPTEIENKKLTQIQRKRMLVEEYRARMRSGLLL